MVNVKVIKVVLKSLVMEEVYAVKKLVEVKEVS